MNTIDKIARTTVSRIFKQKVHFDSEIRFLDLNQELRPFSVSHDRVFFLWGLKSGLIDIFINSRQKILLEAIKDMQGEIISRGGDFSHLAVGLTLKNHASLDVTQTVYLFELSQEQRKEILS